MKKTLLTLAIVAATAAAFAQGKVTIQNDDAHAIVLKGAANLAAADSALAGQAIATTGALPSGKLLVFGLYAGTTANNLALVTSVPTGQLNPAIVPINTVAGTGYGAGTIQPTHALLPFEGGTLAYFQVKVWESTYANYEAAANVLGAYLGTSDVFTMTPGRSSALPYPGINNGGGTTWSGTIAVGIVPEPTTMALAGLGAAALLIFRRRR